ncbi:flagellar hook capping FlgD N-terminal domain-containing protein [Occallatibacter savannae]|uniref:flagellar hook assembly protein FlgD n=1 Tax=Occallatibacter savannae TaxID=1002691 RepID=UPI001EF4116A|nr:flagellar hook capping FlgD N-terminal domain-containing protein [Occallatibacter savannae]
MMGAPIATGPCNQRPEMLARSQTTSSGATNSPASGSSTAIAANDFLTLLVTEMKNQDPTANTDPNQYVNQLVQVNSLEQLISINETLQRQAPKTSVTNSVQEETPISPGLSSTEPAEKTAVASTRLDADRRASSLSGIGSINPAAHRVATALTE